MKYKKIAWKPSPQLMKAPCADSSCCRGKCRWDYYGQRFCLADGNPDLCCAQRQFVFLAAGKRRETLQKWCMPWPCPIIICSGMTLLKAVAASSCGRASRWLHMVTLNVEFGGGCFCWTISLLSKDCSQQGSQIAAVPLLFS